MNYYKKDYRHVRGDTFSFAFKIEEFGQELDNAYFSCRDSLSDESNLLFQKTLGDGITKVEEGDDTYSYSVRVAPSDTRNIPAGTYFYDLQININEDVFTAMKGKFIIEQDSTWDGE